MTGCRISSVTLKSTAQQIHIVPKVSDLPIIEKMLEAVGHARDIKAESFAFALSGPGGWIVTGYDVGGNTYGLIGALEQIKARILDGVQSE